MTDRELRPKHERPLDLDEEVAIWFDAPTSDDRRRPDVTSTPLTMAPEFSRALGDVHVLVPSRLGLCQARTVRQLPIMGHFDSVGAS